MKVLASNKKAYFNFEILDKFISGIVLKGWEVKSVKNHRISLDGSYIKPVNFELFLEGSVISPLKYAGKIPDNFKTRRIKLLLTKKQIKEIIETSSKIGNTVVPLEIFEDSKGLVKVELALVKGKKKFDKRNTIKNRDIKRFIDIERKKYNI